MEKTLKLGRNDSDLGRNDLGRNGLGAKRPVSVLNIRRLRPFHGRLHCVKFKVIL